MTNKVLTLEEVRAVLADKSCAGHTDAVRALLHKHGAEKLSEIDPAVYPALLQDAEALKAHRRGAGRVAVGKGRCNMKLTDAERAKLAAAIKHFEALQKRYTRQHNGTACEYVRLALIGLKRMEQEPEVVLCRDCYLGDTEGSFTPGMVYCDHFDQAVGPDFYCMCGKTRMDADAPERAEWR